MFKYITTFSLFLAPLEERQKYQNFKLKTRSGGKNLTENDTFKEDVHKTGHRMELLCFITFYVALFTFQFSVRVKVCNVGFQHALVSSKFLTV